jgi:hypothetical protein
MFEGYLAKVLDIRAQFLIWVHGLQDNQLFHPAPFSVERRLLMVRCPVRLTVFFLALWILGMAQPARADIVHLTLQSQPGDFIGQGKNFDLTYPQPGDTFFFVNIGSTLPSGAPTNVGFILGRVTPDNTFATLAFGTNQLGAPLTPGTFYDNAQREPFAQPGHPGLEVSFQNRGCNTLTGNFTVNDLTYTTDPVTGALKLLTFDATFEQHCEGLPPALFGRIQFNEPEVVPEPSTLVLFGAGSLGLIGYGWRRRKQAR